MKRSILGTYLTSILLAPDSAPGLSITGDAELDSTVMGRLGVQMEEPAATPDPKPAAPAKDAEAEAAAAAEKARIAEKAEEEGKTPEEVIAEEKAAADEEARIAAKIEETGKTREDILAEEAAGAGDQTEPEFTEEQRAWLDQQAEASTAELTEAKEKLEAAEAKVLELEQQVAAGSDTPVAIADVHPFFLLDDPAKLLEEDAKLAAFEKWALKNWNGTQEIPAEGNRPAVPAYTGEQVRERYAAIQQLRKELIPAARQSIADRKKHEDVARKLYPELFDAKRPEYKTAQNLLRLAPGLKAVIPNVYTVIGDALRGEKIRLAEEKARAAKRPVGKTTPAPTVPARPAPGGATRTATAAAKPKGSDVDVQKFMDAGGDRSALIHALS